MTEPVEKSFERGPRRIELPEPEERAIEVGSVVLDASTVVPEESVDKFEKVSLSDDEINTLCKADDPFDQFVENILAQHGMHRNERYIVTKADGSRVGVSTDINDFGTLFELES
jgi:hypothetical protein